MNVFYRESKNFPGVWRAEVLGSEEDWLACSAAGGQIPGCLIASLDKTILGRPDAINAWAAKVPGLSQPFQQETPRLLSPSPTNLHPYQADGVAWLKAGMKQGRILADDMGLGKTRQALCAAEGSVCVISPAGACHQWKAEANALGVECSVWSYGKALSGLRGEIVPGTIIVDEAHRLKKRSSKTWGALGNYIRRVPNRILLTGTPVDDRVRDVWALLNLLEYGSFGTYYAFSKAYCGGQPGEHGGWIDTDSPPSPELRERLKWWVLRRTQAEIAKALGVSKTRQIVTAKVWGDVPHETLRVTQSNLSAGNSCVIFTRRRASAFGVADICERAGLVVFRLTGEDSPEVRVGRIEQARKLAGGGTPVVCVATIAACGEALNLDFASVGIFAELDFRATQILQAEARIYRLAGNAHNCKYYYIVPEDGVYDRAVRIVLSKLDHLEAALGEHPDATDLRYQLANVGESSMTALFEELGKQAATELFLLGSDE